MEFKYMEIMEYIKSEINKGTFKNKLPSIRGLAIKFSCSNSTVIKAYSELEAAGIIYSAPKSGYYINPNRKEGENEFDFYSGIPLSSYLPFDSMEKAYASSFKDNNIGILNYSYSRGYEKLRENIADSFDLNIDKSRVFILSGTQNFINLMIAISIRENENILLENPTYNLLVGAMEAYGKNIQYINRDLNGLDLNELEKKAKNKDFKYFYTMTRNHNPLGTSLDRETRKKVIELAGEYDFYIIEDDYLNELSEGDPLFNENPDRVIYVRSFSKTISPSLRLCSMIVPDNLKDQISKTNNFMNTGASLISQDVLDRYLNSKEYEKNIKALKEKMTEKCNILRSILEKTCPYPFFVPKSGMYAYIELPQSFRTMELLDSLDQKGYRFRSDVEFSITREIKGLRISLSRIDAKSIEKPINELIKEMNAISDFKSEAKDIYI